MRHRLLNQLWDHRWVAIDKTVRMPAFKVVEVAVKQVVKDVLVAVQELVRAVVLVAVVQIAEAHVQVGVLDNAVVDVTMDAMDAPEVVKVPVRMDAMVILHELISKYET